MVWICSAKNRDIDLEDDIIGEGDIIILDVAMKLIPAPIFRSGRSSTSLLPGWLMIFLGAIWAQSFSGWSSWRSEHWWNSHTNILGPADWGSLGHPDVHQGTQGHTEAHCSTLENTHWGTLEQLKARPLMERATPVSSGQTLSKSKTPCYEIVYKRWI